MEVYFTIMSNFSLLKEVLYRPTPQFTISSHPNIHKASQCRPPLLQCRQEHTRWPATTTPGKTPQSFTLPRSHHRETTGPPRHPYPLDGISPVTRYPPATPIWSNPHPHHPTSARVNPPCLPRDTFKCPLEGEQPFANPILAAAVETPPSPLPMTLLERLEWLEGRLRMER